jgi:hypothetical protein
MDDSEQCPLCHTILNAETSKDPIPAMDYPEIFRKVRAMTFFARILLTVCFVTSMITVAVNVQSGGMAWSAIVSASLFYVYFLILIMSSKKTGYMSRINLTLLLTLSLTIIIDVVCDFKGWSVNFCLPSTIIICNVVALLLMIINRRNWQSYMMYQLITVFLGLVPVLLVKLGIVTHPVLSEIAFISSVSVFLGTLIIGGGAARAELGRRFHI